MKQALRPHIIILLGIIALLLIPTGIVLAARWVSHSQWMLGYEFGDVCTDSFSFGMADSELHTYDIRFFLDGDGPDGTPVGQKTGIQIPPITAAPQEYCDPLPPNTNGFEVNYCGGVTVVWNNAPLPVGTELEMWAYNESGEIDNAAPVNDQFRVSNCSPADIQAVLLQTEPGSTATTISTDLVFEIETYDQNIGTSNGDGINNVDMRIIDSDGVEVRQKTEFNPGYCAFGGDDPCNQWVFSEHNYEWPNGMLIKNGDHTLQATVNADSGESTTVTHDIQIQLPLVTNLIQTGPGTIASVVSDTLVFQLEAYVGPRYSDGQDIDNVVMSILDPNGDTVHQRTEYYAGYCAFGGGSPNCNLWVFSNHNNEWPSGLPLEYGFHTLQAIVNTADGRSKVWSETTIEIQDPMVDPSPVLVYLPLIVR